MLNRGGIKVLNGFISVTAGQAAIYVLSFVRNLILARMLSRADFGLAATFGLAVVMLELTSKMALGQQLVQARDGDSNYFLANVHSIQFIAGAIGSGMLLILCAPMAHVFKVPDKTWAFALVGLVPLFRGLWHMDFQRSQRQFDFKPSIWVELIPQAIVTAVVWPLTTWIGDFRVVLVLLLGKELLTLLMSHLLARQPYRWAWESALTRRIWDFSWPLILNGLFIFAAQQGDQVLVGGGYSIEILALYSVAASLIAVPFMVVSCATNCVMLPVLSRVQGSCVQFNIEYKTCVELIAVGAMATMVPIALLGEQLLKIFFGLKYAGGGAIVAWLAAGCAFRFLRIAPTMAAMALADTQNHMISNLFRITSLFLGSGVMLLGASVEFIAASAFVGEMIALIASTLRLKHRQGLPVADTFRCAGYLAISFTFVGALIWSGAHEWKASVIFSVSASMAIVILAGSRWTCSDSIRRLWNQLSYMFAHYGGSQGHRSSAKTK